MSPSQPDRQAAPNCRKESPVRSTTWPVARKGRSSSVNIREHWVPRNLLGGAGPLADGCQIVTEEAMYVGNVQLQRSHRGVPL
jgi:hypothetical protein